MIRDGLAAKYLQYRSQDGKKYTRYFYTKGDMDSYWKAFKAVRIQRTAIKVKENDKNQCWFD